MYQPIIYDVNNWDRMKNLDFQSICFPRLFPPFVYLCVQVSIMQCGILALFYDNLKHLPVDNKNSGEDMFSPFYP